MELERAGGHAGADGEPLAFLPYRNLEALLTGAAYREDDPAVQ